MSTKINVTISVDDVHPEIGWGMQGDRQMEYFAELNKEFGAKFTLFIPSNYHHKFPLSQHKDWIKWLKSLEYFELAAHGHFHRCERTDIGECEFYELDTRDKAEIRIKQCLDEWFDVGHIPIGWRNPGWLAHQNSINSISRHFKYAALHYEHNQNSNWAPCKMLYGHDGIHETDISLHCNNTIMFQSHINGVHNDNIWNENNYKQIQYSLGYFLKNHYIVSYKTLNEL